ncbi:hypothetical protein ACPOL_5037 [Acidisarcina polymorpha]|uniref:Uncharacterized protein n=1 Tax=Acidisarcina polymorpha TaxID=2211140 RepID=A0A2Z5G6M8_9BACT|nr:hypothetical protein ACPOL_5037 [Acidisarcina polymorpha]
MDAIGSGAVLQVDSSRDLFLLPEPLHLAQFGTFEKNDL